MRILRRGISRFTDPGKPHLSPAFIRFLRVHACFAAILQLNSVFMNTFLQRATGGSEAVMRFNIVLAAAQPIAMLAAVILARHRSAIRAQQAGLALHAMIYIALIALGENIIPYIPVIAAAQSAAAGFYYTAYTPQLLSYTQDRERDRAMGVMSAIGGMLSLTIPVAAGALASAYADFTGYSLLFLLGLITAVVSLVFSLKEAPVTAVPQGKSCLKKAARAMAASRAMRAAMLATLVNGVYGGTFSFYLNVLLYEIVSSEMLIGTNAMLGGLAGIFGSALYARYVKPEMRTKAMAISISLALVGAAGLFLGLSPAMLLIFTAVLHLLAPFFTHPPVTTYMQALGSIPALNGLGAEVHALREFFYATGRVSGILIVLATPTGGTGTVWVVAFLLATQFIAMWLTRETQRNSKGSVDHA